MLRQIFSNQNKVDIWADSKVHIPKCTPSLGMASLRGLADGLIMGFVTGGVLGIMQGWVSDAKTKELCVLSSSWALNGAAIGAIALALGNAIFYVDMSPNYYSVR